MAGGQFLGSAAHPDTIGRLQQPGAPQSQIPSCFPASIFGKCLTIGILVSLAHCFFLPSVQAKAKVQVGKLQVSGPVYNDSAFQHFVTGDLLVLQGDFEGAVLAFRTALQYDFYSAEIRYSLAQCFFTLQRFAEAAGVIDSINNKIAEHYFLLGDCYRKLSHDEKARAAYLKGVLADSSNATAWWYLVSYYKQIQNYDSAAIAASQVYRLRPNHYYLEQYVYILLKANKFEKAVAECQRAIKKDSTFENLYTLLAKVYEANGQIKEALEIYRQAHKISSSVQIKRMLGTLYFKTDQFPHAESVFSAIYSIDSSDIEAVFHLGWSTFYQNHILEARRWFERLIAINDSRPNGWVGLGLIWLTQDSVARAIKVLRNGLARADADGELLYFCGRAYAQAKQFDSAIVYFRRAEELEPGGLRILNALSSAYEQNEQSDSAVTVLERLLAKYPDNPQVNNNLGYMFAERGKRLDEALRLIQKALKKEPENSAYLYSYGWVLFKLGKLEEAERQLRIAVEKSVKDAVIFEHLGDVLFQRGKIDEARQQWGKALLIDPNNQKLKEKLAR